MDFPEDWFEDGNREEWLEWIIFCLEGAAHKDELNWPAKMWPVSLKATGYGWLLKPRIKAWLLECMPKMRELRLWAIGKNADMFAAMKQSYDDGHVRI